MNNKNIFYNPQIDYEKDYHTKGKKETSRTEKENDYNNNVLANLKKKIDSIDSIIETMPEDISGVVNKPYNEIKKIIGDLDEYSEDNVPEIIITVKDDAEKQASSEEYDSDPFSNDDIEIVFNDTEKSDEILEDYNNDLLSIVDDYVDELNSILSKYYDNLISIFAEIKTDDIGKIMVNYTESTSMVEMNYKHLSDLIIRSQYSRNMKNRMCNKLFSVDNTINHIKMCKAAANQRIRYYEEKYMEDESMHKIISNKMLEASRNTYDAKYVHNFKALYKYLHSSVILINECISMFINELQAKTILLNRKGEK